METELCALAPADWRVRSVDDVCLCVTSGGTPSRRDSASYAAGNWPWVKTQELQDGWLDDTEEHITDEAVASSSAKVLPEKTVLVAMYGATVGQLGLLRRPMTCNQACSALIVDPAKADFRYLFFQLLHSRSQLKGLATGAAQQNLSGVLIKSLRFPFPPLPEQRAIAHILGTLDDRIELNRRMNETLEAMARALFKSWFVDFDPVRAKAEGRDPGLPCDFAALFPDRFQGSELGGVPEGWEVGRAGDLVLLGGEKLNPSQFPDEVFDHFSIPAYDEGRTPKAERGEDIKSAKSMVLAESVLLSRLNPRFPRVWLPSLAGRRRATCSTEFLVCVPGQPVTREYLYSLFTSQEFAAEFATFVTGTSGSHQRVKQESLLAMRVLQPPAPAVGAYTTMVAPLLAQIQESIDQSRTLAALRDALLPKLVSGEIRVATDEVKVE